MSDPCLTLVGHWGSHDLDVVSSCPPAEPHEKLPPVYSGMVAVVEPDDAREGHPFYAGVRECDGKPQHPRGLLVFDIEGPEVVRAATVKKA